MSVILLLTALACAGKPTASEPLSAAEIETIRTTHATAETMVGPHADWAAWTAAHYTADAVLLPPNGPVVQGRDAIAAYMASFPPITAFDTTDHDVVGYGDLAYIRGSYEMTLSPPEGPTVRDVGKYIEIWRRQHDGSWRCAADSFSSDLSP